MEIKKLPHNFECFCCRRPRNGRRKVPLYILRAELNRRKVSYIPMHVPTKYPTEYDDLPFNVNMLVVGEPLFGLSRLKKTLIRKNAVNKHFDYL